jgi:hypothetical protein
MDVKEDAVLLHRLFITYAGLSKRQSSSYNTICVYINLNNLRMLLMDNSHRRRHMGDLSRLTFCLLLII